MSRPVPLQKKQFQLRLGSNPVPLQWEHLYPACKIPSSLWACFVVCAFRCSAVPTRAKAPRAITMIFFFMLFVLSKKAFSDKEYSTFAGILRACAKRVNDKCFLVFHLLTPFINYRISTSSYTKSEKKQQKSAISQFCWISRLKLKRKMNLEKVFWGRNSLRKTSPRNMSENKKAEHSLSLYQRSDQEPAKKTQRSIRQDLLVQSTIALPATLQPFFLANNFYLVGFWYIC